FAGSRSMLGASHSVTPSSLRSTTMRHGVSSLGACHSVAQSSLHSMMSATEWRAPGASSHHPPQSFEALLEAALLLPVDLGQRRIVRRRAERAWARDVDARQPG